MTMSLNLPRLSKPEDGEKIPAHTLGYVCGKAKSDAGDLLLKALRESGLTQLEVAQRLGKNPGFVSRSIGASNNLTLESLSSILFAINGQALEFGTSDFLDAPKRNHTRPEYITGCQATMIYGSQIVDTSQPESGVSDHYWQIGGVTMTVRTKDESEGLRAS